ncbi:aldo/keto reductase [Scytonema sp. UIC 10036]|uniref:aldo/keto reductase family protein n=1 Tax=Scytonema sp. UIC 10036 TaxID=2304196 RepID=UPI0012DAC0A4|nr:aldo/keto reductase family protein [Scytonema sp. UIC 10036]MUG96169.1 aldo/keto reductase [Scytonema sp. UIC 10036]
MKYRQLGKSELNVSEISLGSWLTYGGGVERQQAEACIHKAFDVGINFIDTANVYGHGAAESLLGEVLQGIDRNSYIFATKVYFPMSPTDKGLSAAQIYKQIDASLQRLRTDYVDLYQCHRYDVNTPLEETMAALTDVVRQGKVRYIGFSEWNPAQIQAALNLPNVEQFISSQPQYSMLWRQPEVEVFPLCAANGITQIVWSPLAQGVLTGKYKPGEAPPQDSRAANDQMNGFMQDLRSDRVLSAVQNLKPIAQRLNLSMAQLALAWVLRDERVSSAIIGASRPEQVADNAGASGVRLSSEVLREIDDILAPALPYATAR